MVSPDLAYTMIAVMDPYLMLNMSRWGLTEGKKGQEEGSSYSRKTKELCNSFIRRNLGLPSSIALRTI